MNPALKKSRHKPSPVTEPQSEPVQPDLPLCELVQQREMPVMSRIPKYRVALVREKSLPWPSRRLAASQSVWEFGKQLTESADREQFWALMLDTKNSLIGVSLISQGSLSSAIVHPREVLKAAILLSAAAIVVLHNHPSGDPAPSSEDRECTDQLAEACKVVGIRLLDHVIVGEVGYFSFADTRGNMLC